jgi:ligand-binding sensor domain-containing protein
MFARYLSLVAIFLAVSCKEVDISPFPNWQNFAIENSSLPSNYIDEITVDNDGIAWIASANYLVRFDGNSFTSFKFSETSGERTGKIFIDHLNNKWFATYYWVYKFNGSSFEKYEPVLGLYLQRDKRLCMVRRSLVETLDIDTGESEFCETPGDQSGYLVSYKSMIEDLKGRKFGFRQNSIDGYVLDVTLDFCTKGQSIDGGDLGELVLSPDSLIYRTSRYGFNIIKTDLEIKYIDPANYQLPSAWILDIAISDNGSRVWVGCNKKYEDHFFTSAPRVGGLVEYNPADGKIAVYNTSNSGMVSDHVAAVAVSNNKILVGTDMGLSVYTP